jgi:Glyoxalase-like domain
VATSVQVVFDCADPSRMTEFWAATLGYKEDDPPQGFASWPEWLTAHGVPEEEWNSASACSDPEGVGPRLYFQRVPESKTVKNRVHLDVNAGGPRGTPPEERRRRVDAEVQRLLGLGATRLGVVEQYGEYCVNMRDPEGNEFDVQ